MLERSSPGGKRAKNAPFFPGKGKERWGQRKKKRESPPRRKVSLKGGVAHGGPLSLIPKRVKEKLLLGKEGKRAEKK